MRNAAFVAVIFLGALGSAFEYPAFAQNSVGGPTKRTVIGGPVKQTSPVLPPNKGGSILVSQGPASPRPISSPPAPPPPPSHVKCTIGPCLVKGSNR
jgi:hypothetical protein